MLDNNFLRHQNTDIAPDVQERLNTPLSTNDFSVEDEKFLKFIVSKVDSKGIDLYKPSSLFNVEVYDSLSPDAKAKAETDAFNMVATIREIYKLWQAGHKETFQLMNLIHKVRVMKERLEEAGGDIFII